LNNAVADVNVCRLTGILLLPKIAVLMILK